MNELEGRAEKKPRPLAMALPSLNCCNTQNERDSPENEKSVGYRSPIPLKKGKGKNASGRGRRHNTISSASSKDILAAALRYNEDLADDDGGFVVHKEKERVVPDEICYDIQLRLDSPDKIYIPERSTDFEEELEEVRSRRKVKAENIRRMLAAPP